MIKKASSVEMFEQGCACSQAVLASYCEQYGLDPKFALKLASGFGGGMRMAETCGAATGAYMVLGLENGDDHDNTSAGREKVSEAVIEFSRRFKQNNGAMKCRDLLGHDISTPEGSQAATDNNVFDMVCPKLVQSSVDILDDMLKK